MRVPLLHAFALPGACLGLVVAALLLGACTRAPKLARLAPGAVVLAFGDSLSFGTGAAEGQSYPAQLELLTGLRVVRAGVPGEVTAQALARLPAALEEHAPKLLLLCSGGNDFLQRLERGRAAENLRAMVRLARSRGIEVLLIGVPEPGFSMAPPAFYAEIAGEFGLPYEAEAIREVLGNEELKSDPVHPNARGYRLIAERIAQRLRKSGAIP